MRERVAQRAGAGSIGRLEAGLEVAFCLAMALGYVIARALHTPVRFVIVGLGLALVGYAVRVWRRGGESPRDFGLRADNLGPAARETGLFTAAVAVLLVLFGWLRGVPLWRPEFFVLLPLYPLYGIGQQLVVQGIFHRRLLAVTESPAISVAATAAAFGMLHSGDPRLLLLTVGGGLFWAILYERHPNIWVLGISHGLLASLAYPFVLDVNPLTRL